MSSKRNVLSMNSNNFKKKNRPTNLQTTQPPISNSGAFTTLVNLITIGLDIFEDSPQAVFLGSNLSLQSGQCQLRSGTRWKSKQAATK